MGRLIELPMVLLIAIGAMNLIASSGCRDTHVPAAVTVYRGEIVPGYGINGCHIGMSANDLKGRWVRRGKENRIGVILLCNAESGIFLSVQNKTILAITFAYQVSGYSDLENSFVDRTREGVSADSSPEDVIRTYGQPTTIDLIKRTEDEEVVDMRYFKAGLCFSFLNSELHTITVVKPNRHFDSAIDTDIGDTSRLRAISTSGRIDRYP